MRNDDSCVHLLSTLIIKNQAYAKHKIGYRFDPNFNIIKRFFNLLLLKCELKSKIKLEKQDLVPMEEEEEKYVLSSEGTHSACFHIHILYIKEDD